MGSFAYLEVLLRHNIEFLNRCPEIQRPTCFYGELLLDVFPLFGGDRAGACQSEGTAILIERGLAMHVHSFGKEATCGLDQGLLMHVGIEIHLPTGFVGKVCNLLQIALPRYVWEVEVYPEDAFIRISPNPLKTRDLSHY